MYHTKGDNRNLAPQNDFTALVFLFGKATQVAEVKADVYKPRDLTKEEALEYMKLLNETY